MNYALGFSFGIKDLFEKFNWKRLKFSCKDAYEINNDLHKLKLVYNIFKEHLLEVLEDVVENNITFLLPTGAKSSDIHMKVTSGELFKLARQKGKFKGVDFLTSFFRGFDLGFYTYGSGRTRCKTIYVTKQLKDRILEKTNEGFNYG